MGPTSAVVPSRNAWRDGSAASHLAIGVSACTAAVGSMKAVLLGLNLTGDSPVKMIVVCVFALTCWVGGTGTWCTGWSVLTDGPWPGCGMISTVAPADLTTVAQI